MISTEGFLTLSGLFESRLHRRRVSRKAVPDFLKAGLSRREGFVSRPKGPLEGAGRFLSSLDRLGLRGDFGRPVLNFPGASVEGTPVPFDLAGQLIDGLAVVRQLLFPSSKIPKRCLTASSNLS